MIELGVNIDHVATLRQARQTYEPDPVWAAALAELGGADCITIHLREDRRHILDHDVRRLRKTVHCKFNFELSLAPDIVDIAMEVMPDQITLVPERRQEVTTEGGLDIITQSQRVSEVLERFREAGVTTSAFIDADETQVRHAAKLGFNAIELHTGSYANAANALDQQRELDDLRGAGELCVSLGMRLHAGHGLNYRNTLPVARLAHMAELNIGHAIISKAVFVGLQQAVAEMKAILTQAVSSPAS